MAAPGGPGSSRTTVSPRPASCSLRPGGSTGSGFSPFRLADCADDVAALLDAIGVEYATIVGYSMGGAVAQLVWRRHRPRVRSLVLAATSRNFASSREESISFMGLAGLAVVSRVVPDSIRQRIAEQYVDKRAGMGWETWALEQIRSHDWTAVLEAGRAIGSFSSIDWIGSVDVPTSVIVNSDDHVVPTHRQLALSESITHARVFHIEGDHDVCVVGADRFVPLLIEAIAVSLHDA